MKKVFVVGLVLVGGGALFVWLGIYNVAATDEHWAVTTKFLELVRERSIEVRSEDLLVPDLEDPELIALGAREYIEMCVACHLAPGEPATEINKGLYPRPPSFFEAEHAIHDPKETFWVIENGIKFTGMPAWGAVHDEDEMWGLVAFMTKMNGMSPEDYRTATGEFDGAGHHED